MQSKLDPRFAKGVQPAEVIMEVLNAAGYISNAQLQKWEDAPLREKFKLADKMTAPKVGRPPLIPDWGLNPGPRSFSADRLANKVIKHGPDIIFNPIPQGRPMKKQDPWTQEEINYICSKGTLIKHAAYPIKSRAIEYQQLFGKKLDEKTLRAIY